MTHAPPPTLRTTAQLAAADLIAPEQAGGLDAVAARYAIAITPAMAALARADGPDGPIARQFVPTLAELTVTPEERADPIGDNAFMPVPGLVHRYPDRVLLKPTHACPVYCRFCFRREMVGPGGRAMSEEDVAAALAYVRARPEIFEVIVTGGDPLMLPARRIERLVAAIGAIPHVGLVRFHSRVPVVAPERVTASLVAALRASPAVPWLGIHANHAREFTPEAREALARLADGGIPLVGQTVLLRGVNDDVATLAALMRAFLSARVKPYYLHHPDLAPGTSHFRLPVAEGQALVAALRRAVTGLAQPAYVLDVPGGAGKVPIGPSHLHGDGRVETRDGVLVPYPAE